MSCIAINIITVRHQALIMVLFDVRHQASVRESRSGIGYQAFIRKPDQAFARNRLKALDHARKNFWKLKKLKKKIKNCLAISPYTKLQRK